MKAGDGRRARRDGTARRERRTSEFTATRKLVVLE
jgi:hypothetical protein